MKSWLLFIYAVIILVGCQKNPEYDLSTGITLGESSDGRQLSRIVFQYSPTDSAYTDLIYDSKGRWVGTKTNNDNPVLNDYVQTRLYRTPAGIGTRYVTWKKATGGTDSIVYRLQYSAAGHQYTAKVRINPASEVALDSTEYLYKDGRIIAAHLYMRPGTLVPYSEQAKAEFSYNSSGQLTGLRSFVVRKPPGSGFDLFSETAFAYDDKVNPLCLGMQAIVLDQIFFVSESNIIRITINDATSPTLQNEVIDFVYRYHLSSKPRSAQWRTSLAAIPMFYRYK